MLAVGKQGFDFFFSLKEIIIESCSVHVLECEQFSGV